MVLSSDACVYTHAVVNRLQQSLAELSRTWQKLIKLVEFGKIQSSVDFTETFILAEFGRIQSSWQNLAELICRVFHRDIPTVTGLVPLQEVNIFLNLIGIGFLLNNLNLFVLVVWAHQDDNIGGNQCFLLKGYI